MGNFEKLSVLVIGVIIVMILVVAIHTWTSDPAAPGASGEGTALAVSDSSRGGPLGPEISTEPLPPGGALSAGLSAGLSADAAAATEDPDYWDPGYSPTPDDAIDRAGGGAADEASGPGDATSDAGVDPVIVPVEPRETAQRTVTVKPGDTLGHISQRAYGTTRHWKKIAEVNNIDPRTIRPNMVLIIPDVGGPTPGAVPAVAVGGARPVKGSAYKVRSGDTIENISKAAFGNVERWPDIWFENMERISDPDDLEAGIEISIPN